ncbi:testis-specific serine/threonine-protein kinase 6-like [Astyanax mexicanus]|uniref:non-specific serine/threonine protein kinase n=1 Tax=Astyanax mexicanus TaxID=7994 RepID=A0A8T2KRW7_ASTMX|nr:testis-specific serine/threonine-protein kinase 6-like [Astyanax mexicanus]
MEAAKTNLSDKIYTVGHVSFDRAKQWFSQLLSAMVYLHQQDIAHRDLKSENVLLTADNRIKLADFGLAFVGEGFPNMTNTYCGTLQYTAPEVILGLPYDPMKSDVWSLGVILYEMVTGDLPFDTTNVRKLLELQHEPLPRVNLLCLRATPTPKCTHRLLCTQICKFILTFILAEYSSLGCNNSQGLRDLGQKKTPKSPRIPSSN